MEAGWGNAFVQRFRDEYEDDAIATILTKDNREFYACPDEVEVLPSFPAAWRVQKRAFIPESEIVRVEVSGDRKEDG